MLNHILSINPDRWHDAKGETVEISKALEKKKKWGHMQTVAYMDMLVQLDTLPDLIRNIGKYYKIIWEATELPEVQSLKSFETAIGFIVDVNRKSLAELAIREVKAQVEALRRRNVFTEAHGDAANRMQNDLKYEIWTTCYRIDNRYKVMLDFKPDL